MTVWYKGDFASDTAGFTSDFVQWYLLKGLHSYIVC